MKRLETVFSLITPCKVFADIGTDHGQIAAYAAELCGRVIATDISEQCLSKARGYISAGNVEFAAGDGLKPLNGCVPQAEPDQIAICGMGGRTIIDILCSYKGGASLILQPQTDAPLLREFLCDNGFVITHDITAFEGGKYYDIIKTRHSPTEARKYDELAYKFGIFYHRQGALLRERLLALRRKFEGYKQCGKNIRILADIDAALAELSAYESELQQ